MPVANSSLAAALARIAGPGPALTLKDTRVVVVRAGDVVVKAHTEDTDAVDLDARLKAATGLGGVMLAPHRASAERVADRLVTSWPAGEPVDPETPEAAPWEEGGRLLARLHASPVNGPLPPAGGPLRVAQAMARLDRVDAGSAGAAIRQAYAGLPPSATRSVRPPDLPPSGTRSTRPPDLPPPGTRTVPTGGSSLARPAPTGAPGLTHGDWHLGQMVRHGGRWLLIDVDDLGVGDPAWDLARPAAWFAAGLLESAVWERFLGSYLLAGGHAVSEGDPWRELDVPARALTVQLAALAVVRAREEARPLGEVDEALVFSCGRISRLAPPPAA